MPPPGVLDLCPPILLSEKPEQGGEELCSFRGRHLAAPQTPRPLPGEWGRPQHQHSQSRELKKPAHGRVWHRPEGDNVFKEGELALPFSSGLVTLGLSALPPALRIRSGASLPTAPRPTPRLGTPATHLLSEGTSDRRGASYHEAREPRSCPAGPRLCAGNSPNGGSHSFKNLP